MTRFVKFIAIAPVLMFSGAALAQDTTNYEYDALGRLKKVSHENGVANGVTSTYTYDAANNRTNVTVGRKQIKVVVVPLNGFTIIPLPD